MRRLTPGLVVRIVLILLYLLPLIFVVLASLKSNAEVQNHPSSVIFPVTIEAYRTVITRTLARALLNSLVIATGSTFVTVTLGTPLAYVLARVRARWTGLIIGVLIALQMTPPATSVIPLYRVLALLNALGSYTGVIIAIAAGALPYAILLLRPFFLAVPPAVEEAAQIDGAGELRTFLQVVLPLARNGVLLITVLLFIGAWGEFLYAVSFLNDAQLFPLSVNLVQQQGFYGTQYNNLMALALIGAAPTVVLFAFVAKRLTSGLALGVGK